ncbi:hypothetical protein EKD00_08940 [Chlorobium phaeovibrioides]|uniref:Uncharacterized protein n=1 Tax=Chlorobium phaeovibrioides TaxID=1094 RepID=A0A5M8I8R6_CHLPH|nr:hypothetical protein [Chlorobium phaeovibrioides]KAA6230604.1 hypothetical protein FP507_10120 [Chlorobium phaeovibrioides]RTY33724.1 hypothetical protein EKD00_08940 [Chlorobium phaeovibrioides]
MGRQRAGLLRFTEIITGTATPTRGTPSSFISHRTGIVRRLPLHFFLNVAGFLGIPLNYFITVEIKGRSTTARRDAN